MMRIDLGYRGTALAIRFEIRLQIFDLGF